MSDPTIVKFRDQDADCTITELDGGIALNLRHGNHYVRVVIDHESAWQLADALARVVSRAALSLAQATKEAPK